jgi:hypothetical protein
MTNWIDHQWQAARAYRTFDDSVAALPLTGAEEVWVIDFSVSVRTQQSARQTQQEFMEYSTVTVMGAVMYRRSNEPPHNTHRHAALFVSPDTKHDGEMAIACLSVAFSEAAQRRVRTVKLFSDNGSHFKSYETAQFILVEAKTRYQIRCEMHAFTPGESKNDNDRLFGTMRQAIHTHVRCGNDLRGGINGINDVWEALRHRLPHVDLYQLTPSRAAINAQCEPNGVGRSFGIREARKIWMSSMGEVLTTNYLSPNAPISTHNPKRKGESPPDTANDDEEFTPPAKRRKQSTKTATKRPTNTPTKDDELSEDGESDDEANYRAALMGKNLANVTRKRPAASVTQPLLTPQGRRSLTAARKGREDRQTLRKTASAKAAQQTRNRTKQSPYKQLQ